MSDAVTDPYPAGPKLVATRLSSAEMLKLTRSSDRKAVYFLQATDRRLTVQAQQNRALNLVFSLMEQKAIEPDKKIAVVGGGFSGLTAAVAAASLGCQVTVYESHAELLHIQAGSDTRWIHPHMYDWPDEIAAVSNTDFPFLNWSTGTASEIAEVVLLDFLRHQQRLQAQLQVECSTPVELSKKKDASLIVKGSARSFDCAILATGFGVERPFKNVPFRSYWMCDSLHQPRAHFDSLGQTPVSYLISGTGDGGLIDLLRLKIRNFRHDRLAVNLFQEDRPPTELVELKLALRHLRERALALGSAEERKAALEEGFESLLRSPGFAEIRRRLSDRLRADTTVYLHGIEETFVSPHASILHTFLAFVLSEMGAFKYISKKITGATLTNGEWIVEFEGDKPLPVHDIVVRHGAALEEGSTVTKAVEPYRKELVPERMLGLEQTAIRVEHNTNEWWYTRGVPRPVDQRSLPTASQQREQMTSTRRSSALLEEAVALQRNAFVRSAIAEFINGPLYDAYYDLVYA